MTDKRIDKITFSDIFSKAEMKEITLEWWLAQVYKIRTGKLIKRKYADSTIKRRKRYGLQTAFVDLTGNTKYSKKQWRMLDQGRVKAINNHTAIIEWKRQDAARLWSYHIQHYGSII